MIGEGVQTFKQIERAGGTFGMEGPGPEATKERRRELKLDDSAF